MLLYYLKTIIIALLKLLNSAIYYKAINNYILVKLKNWKRKWLFKENIKANYIIVLLNA
jgi:hypothetical protein